MIEHFSRRRAQIEARYADPSNLCLVAPNGSPLAWANTLTGVTENTIGASGNQIATAGLAPETGRPVMIPP